MTNKAEHPTIIVGYKFKQKKGGDSVATIAVTDENFQNEVLNAETPVLVDFWAEWCGPCKQIGPSLEEISEEMPGVKVVKVNIEESLETPTKYGVRGIPTLMLFKNGEVADTKVGALPKTEISSWLGEQS